MVAQSPRSGKSAAEQQQDYEFALAHNRPTLVIEDPTLKKMRRGFAMTPYEVVRARNLSTTSKQLYTTLVLYAFQKGSCWPGIQRLCEDVGKGEESLRAAMKELVGVGLVGIKRRGLGLTNVYTLLDLQQAKLEVPFDADAAAMAGEPETPDLPDPGVSGYQDDTPSPDPRFGGDQEPRNQGDKEEEVGNREVGEGEVACAREGDQAGAITVLAAMVAGQLGIGDYPDQVAQVQRKIDKVRTLLAGRPFDYVEAAVDCRQWHQANRSKVRSWPLTYGHWLEKAVDRPVKPATGAAGPYRQGNGHQGHNSGPAAGASAGAPGQHRRFGQYDREAQERWDRMAADRAARAVQGTLGAAP